MVELVKRGLIQAAVLNLLNPATVTLDGINVSALHGWAMRSDVGDPEVVRSADEDR